MTVSWYLASRTLVAALRLLLLESTCSDVSIKSKGTASADSPCSMPACTARPPSTHMESVLLGTRSKRFHLGKRSERTFSLMVGIHRPLCVPARHPMWPCKELLRQVRCPGTINFCRALVMLELRVWKPFKLRHGTTVGSKQRGCVQTNRPCAQTMPILIDIPQQDRAVTFGKCLRQATGQQGRTRRCTRRTEELRTHLFTA